MNEHQQDERVEIATVDEVVSGLARDCAEHARAYVQTVHDIASGDNSGAAIPMGLLALSQVLVMGARLGAIEDVVPRDQFESDAGPDVDLDPLLDALQAQFDALHP